MLGATANEAASNAKEGPRRFKKIPPETLTPHKLATALLIKCYFQFKESAEDMANFTPLQKVKFRREFCILALKIMHAPDLKLHELKSMLVAYHTLLPVYEKWNTNLERIYYDGVASILDANDELREILIMGDLNQLDKGYSTISRKSPIGYFLRRFIVFCEKLSFAQTTELYKSFGNYFQEWKKTVQSSLTIDSVKVDEWYLAEKHWSRRQAELFLASQAVLLHNQEEKALPPKELQSKVISILKSNPDLSAAHFMSYLNYLRVEEFCGALQSLHHCFDKRSNIEVDPFQDERSKEYRYGALNLAILYHHFGHTKEALAFLKEAIKLAHAASDNLCLQHALSWLYRLSNINKDNLIVQCIIKTFELNLNYTTSLALQNFARYGSTKMSVKPRVIFETLTKSDMLNSQNNYKDLIFNNHSMKASLWTLYGKKDMCLLWSQILLYLNINTVAQSTAYYGEGYLQAVCNLALNFVSQGEYGFANLIVSYAKQKYPNEPFARAWMLVENWIHYTRALYREEWTDAESAAQKICSLDKWEGYLKMAELYFYQHEYEEANKCLSYIVQNYMYDEHVNDGKFILHRAQILQMEVHFASSYPTVSGIMVTFSNYLIEVEMSELAGQIAIIYLLQAKTLLTSGFPSQAIKVLNSPRCMVEIMANGSLYDKARAALLYTQCLVAVSSRMSAKERRVVLQKRAESLDKVKANFKKVEAFSRVKDVLFLQAQLYNMVDMKVERNKCAAEYRALDAEHTTKNVEGLLKFL